MLYEYMRGFGFTNQEVSAIVCSHPVRRYKNESLYENIKSLFEYLLSIGYSKTNILKMVKLHPGLCCYSSEIINEKVKFLISLGYTKEEVLKMTVVSSSMFGLSIDNIKSKINNLLELNFNFSVRDDISIVKYSIVTA